MNYPLISEYIESIMSAEDNFDQLSSLRPVLDSYGNPIMSSGNFAVVFKMKDIDTGKFYAVKCFIKDQEGRNESYAMIADELKNANSPYILPIKFLENELFVDTSQSNETEFPVLVMDWVEGKTLDAYLRENLDNKYRLQVLSYRFCQMSAWLMSQPFAHGDLKPDNILVRENGSLVLVDYDGFYVPAMKGDEARELGSPDFRHPQRTPQDFDEHIDDFSISTIALSLKAISIDAQLYHNYAASDRLLLSTNDYHDIGNSATMQKISQLASDSELTTLIGAFYIALSNKTLKKISNNVFDIEMPAIIIGEGKTIITKEDVKQAEKEYGELTNVVIADSVTGIGKSAFDGCSGLTSINIPNSVIEIGARAFSGCIGLIEVNIVDLSAWCKIDFGGLDVKVNPLYYAKRLNLNGIEIKDLVIPNNITEIKDKTFYGCANLTSVSIPNSVAKIGKSTFSRCSELTSIVVDYRNEKYDSRDNCNAIIEKSTNSLLVGCKNTIIPDSVTTIGDSAFLGCSGLTSVTIPNSVTTIGSFAFYGCTGLTSVTIPNSVTTIGTCAFVDCSGLTSVTIGNSVTSIGFDAFRGCGGLNSIIVDNENKKYDSRDNCNAIIEKSTNSLLVGCKNTIIPDSVTTIGNRAFLGCSGLTSVTIPNSVTTIGNCAFVDCTGLTFVTIGNSVTSIGDCAFYGCSGLTSVTIPNSVTSIGSEAFRFCTGLTSVTIGNSVTSIGSSAFSNTPWYNNQLDGVIYINNVLYKYKGTMPAGTSIEVKDGTISISGNAFSGCTGLTSVTIGNSVTSIGYYAFRGCSGLTSVTIPNSVTSIGSYAFSRCRQLANIVIPKGSRQRFEGLLESDLHSKLVEQ